MDTREVIDKYYEYGRSGNRAGWLSLFADDIVMDEQLEGHIVGIDNLRETIGKMDKGYARFHNQPQHFVIDGEQACVISHISAVTESGVSIEAGVANYFQVQDGKITYMANFHDTKPFDAYVQQQAQ
jgi:ketosteroid isomerase-like protein